MSPSGVAPAVAAEPVPVLSDEDAPSEAPEFAENECGSCMCTQALALRAAASQ